MPYPSPRSRIVPGLPTIDLPSPWNITFTHLDQPQICLFPLSPAMQLRLDMEDADRRIALYWVIKKKWFPRLKIPVNRNYSKLLEPWGELMYRTLELAIACHNSPIAPPSPYRNAAHCYLQVVQEAQRLDLQEILANEPTGKTRFISNQYSIMSAMKKERKETVKPADSSHFFQLIQIALAIREQAEFDHQYWQPFLHACSGWLQAMSKKQCHEIHVEGDRILFQAGRGKAKLVVVDLCKLPVLKARQSKEYEA